MPLDPGSNPLGPGLDPAGNPVFLPEEPGGQLHGTGGPPGADELPPEPTPRSRPRSRTPRAAAPAAGGGSLTSKTLKGAALFGAATAAINSPLDFLKFIAWIFHPRNLLRVVEFVVGIVLMIFGFNAALQARGERIEGFSSSEGVLTRSGLGRVATELGRAARSGQRPQRARSAPHRTRQRALAQRYRREEDLQRRRARNPRPKQTRP